MKKPIFLHQHPEYRNRTSMTVRREENKKKAEKNIISKGIKGTWFLLNTLSRKSSLWVGTTPGDLPTRSVGTFNSLNAKYTPPATLQLVACAHSQVQQ